MNQGEEKDMLTKSPDGTLSLSFNVLVERQETGSFLAHCAELDIVAEADSGHAACAELLDLIDVQVRTCLANDNLENLYFPAPPEVWQKLGRAQQRCAQQKTHRSIPAEGKKFRSVDVNEYCYV
jgi:hypothetical protein